ncbi:MAG: STAS domain-containing protein [Desulfovibrio sp.]|jgi:anti-anti-sigma factor|nr:STAS domain-containing protein [Desulfovibrio sp.]
MDITVTRAPQAHVLHISGRWDFFSAANFEEICDELLRAEDMRDVVLDLAAVPYLSSFGLRAILELAKRLEPLSGNLRVADMQPAVAKVFIGSGFHRLFRHFPDVPSALAALGRKT